MTPDGARHWVTTRLGRPTTGAQRLLGGLLNHVHRVQLAGGGSVVVKQAPAYVAQAPHIPLDPARSSIEAAALRFLSGACVPRLLDAHAHTLILEDIGDLPDLVDWLAAGGDPRILDHLAQWLRSLHEGPAPAIDNRSVQQTRHTLQYAPMGDWLAALGLRDARRLARQVVQMGTRFIAGGPHFVMGDLWPPSVRVHPSGRFTVIDWELATRGHRAQDVGHLVAHLVLAARTRGLDARWPARFLSAYGPLPPQDLHAVRLHCGSELLARTVGAFARTDLTAEQHAQLVADAIEWLRSADGA